VVGTAALVSTDTSVTYDLADGVELGSDPVWQLEQRRAEVREYFSRLAKKHSETLKPGAGRKPERGSR